MTKIVDLGDGFSPFWDANGKLQPPLQCVCGHLKSNHHMMSEKSVMTLLCTMCSCSLYREATHDPDPTLA